MWIYMCLPGSRQWYMLKHINEQHGIAHFNFCIALLYLVNTVISKWWVLRSNFICIQYLLESCGHPDFIANGGRRYFGTTEGSTVNYTCNPGYRMFGASRRICQSNGQWSGSQPSCESKFHYTHLHTLIRECNSTILPVCRNGIGCFVFPIKWYRSKIQEYTENWWRMRRRREYETVLL